MAGYRTFLRSLLIAITMVVLSLCSFHGPDAERYRSRFQGAQRLSSRSSPEQLASATYSRCRIRSTPRLACPSWDPTTFSTVPVPSSFKSPFQRIH
jgi:hypothetical protein